jgi:hypothetical protein
MRDFTFIENEFLKKHKNIDNHEYLSKYISLLLEYVPVFNENDYVEKHHILPTSVFPEYKNHSWNIIDLRYEDHILAHLLLFKSINVRQYQRPLNWMIPYYKNKQEISNSAKKGWIRLKNDTEKYEKWLFKRSQHMKSLSSDEQRRRANIFWSNITEDEYKKFCEQMKNLWTDEKRIKKSESNREFYSNRENRLRKSIESKQRWDSMETEKRIEFQEKMDSINKDERKRKNAGIKIKELWMSEDYLNKMKKRKSRNGLSIKLVNDQGTESVYETMKHLTLTHNFSAHLIRKYRDTGNPISINDLRGNNLYLENYKIYTINK